MNPTQDHISTLLLVFGEFCCKSLPLNIFDSEEQLVLHSQEVGLLALYIFAPISDNPTSREREKIAFLSIQNTCHQYGYSAVWKHHIIIYLFKQAVIVPFMMSGDWDTMRDLANDVQFFNRNLVDLVEQIDAWNVNAIALNHIDKIIRCSVIP